MTKQKKKCIRFHAYFLTPYPISNEYAKESSDEDLKIFPAQKNLIAFKCYISGLLNEQIICDTIQYGNVDNGGQSMSLYFWYFVSADCEPIVDWLNDWRLKVAIPVWDSVTTLAGFEQ